MTACTCTAPNSNCVQYLAASYLYYSEDYSIMPDEDFDLLCKELHGQINDVTHWAKDYLDEQSLLAGTGFHLCRILPGAMVGLAKFWREEVEAGRDFPGWHRKQDTDDVPAPVCGDLFPGFS